MYDRHKPIIKWYEYDARKLYQTAESEDVTDTADSKEALTEEVEIPRDFSDASKPAGSPDMKSGAEAVEASGGQDAPLTGSELDDEVARIMAAFSGAKQNGVDDVFAMMAAEVEAGGTTGDSVEASDDTPAPADAGNSEEELLASILAPKQNGVDDLVAKAREG